MSSITSPHVLLYARGGATIVHPKPIFGKNKRLNSNFHKKIWIKPDFLYYIII